MTARTVLAAPLICVLLGNWTVAAASSPAAGATAEYSQIVELDCDFEFRPGREFQFPTADPILQGYGFVLWKKQPSLRSEPLDYAHYHQRRGKLTGKTLIREGVRWYEGYLDDCSPVYAEDASVHSQLSGMAHLALHGKIIFSDTYAVAKGLIGQTVWVRGTGLEPRQRLYTADPDTHFALHDGEPLKVVGMDLHRYAFAKGVGPFFLRVLNAEGEHGLIKFNPKYLVTPQGELALHLPPRAREFGPRPPRVNAVMGNRPLLTESAYVLNISPFLTKTDGQAAVSELEEAGFAASLLPETLDGAVSYRLLIAGFPTVSLARSMAEILAHRFGRLQPGRPAAER